MGLKKHIIIDELKQLHLKTNLLLEHDVNVDKHHIEVFKKLEKILSSLINHYEIDLFEECFKGIFIHNRDTLLENLKNGIPHKNKSDIILLIEYINKSIKTYISNLGFEMVKVKNEDCNRIQIEIQGFIEDPINFTKELKTSRIKGFKTFIMNDYNLSLIEQKLLDKFNVDRYEVVFNKFENNENKLLRKLKFKVKYENIQWLINNKEIERQIEFLSKPREISQNECNKLLMELNIGLSILIQNLVKDEEIEIYHLVSCLTKISKFYGYETRWFKDFENRRNKSFNREKEILEIKKRTIEQIDFKNISKNITNFERMLNAWAVEQGFHRLNNIDLNNEILSFGINLDFRKETPMHLLMLGLIKKDYSEINENYKFKYVGNRPYLDFKEENIQEVLEVVKRKFPKIHVKNIKSSPLPGSDYYQEFYISEIEIVVRNFSF